MQESVSINKNYHREAPSFANINLLGYCNVDCFFCLGKDLKAELKGHQQVAHNFKSWKNFVPFLQKCRDNNIENLYITGQNTDSLLYGWLADLIYYLQDSGFKVGIRTNGYEAEQQLSTINLCDRSVGYSIHSLNVDTNCKIMRRWDIPRWDRIIPATNNPRVSIVVNRYNGAEFDSLVRYIAKFKNVKYIQARRISTERRKAELQQDIDVYEELYQQVVDRFHKVGEFYGAELFDMYGKEVCFWRTVETSVNSFNYFVDGTISDEYFVVDGYLKNYLK